MGKTIIMVEIRTDKNFFSSIQLGKSLFVVFRRKKSSQEFVYLLKYLYRNKDNIAQGTEDKMIYIENELIGKRLVKIRQEKKLELYDMASILGISAGHYRKIERGIYGLDVLKLLRLYEKLHVDPMYLLLGKVDLSNAYAKSNGLVDHKKMICDLLDYCVGQIKEEWGVEND